MLLYYVIMKLRDNVVDFAVMTFHDSMQLAWSI